MAQWRSGMVIKNEKMKQKIILLLFCSVAAMGVCVAVKIWRNGYAVECNLICMPDSALPLVTNGTAFAEMRLTDKQWTEEKMKDFLSGEFSGDPLYERGDLIERFFLYYKEDVFDRREISDLFQRMKIDSVSDSNDGIRLSVKGMSYAASLSMMKFVIEDFKRSIDESEEYRYGKLLATFNHEMKKVAADKKEMLKLGRKLKSAKEYFRFHRKRVRVLKSPCVKGVSGVVKNMNGSEFPAEKYQRVEMPVTEAKKRQIASVYVKIVHSYMNELPELMREYMEIMPPEERKLLPDERATLIYSFYDEFHKRFLLSDVKKTFGTVDDFERFIRLNVEAAQIMRNLDDKSDVQTVCGEDMVLKRLRKFKEHFADEKKPEFEAVAEKFIMKWQKTCFKRTVDNRVLIDNVLKN